VESLTVAVVWADEQTKNIKESTLKIGAELAHKSWGSVTLVFEVCN